MATSAQRDHALDFLRATAMFLGILLHAVLSFIHTPVHFWATRDIETSQAADVFVLIVHGFRMQIFFFLAGFFGCMLYQRYGLVGVISHRFTRLAIPFALALVIIQPTLQFAWLIGDPLSRGALGLNGVGDVAEHFESGRFFLHIVPTHLWFLYYLILFFVAMIPFVLLGRTMQCTIAAAFGDRLFRKLIGLPGQLVILALLTTPLLLPMLYPGFIDTPQGWQPQWQILGYYFLFFVAGWQFWRHRDLLPGFSKRWRASLLIGNLVVLPFMIWTMVLGLPRTVDSPPLPDLPGRPFLSYYLSAQYTWLMIAGLTGAFQHWFSRERRWVRYLADASYWCYLWHLTPIVLLQIALAPAAIPGFIKLAIVVGGSMLILLATYEWGVRYTFIGVILNGRKTRRLRLAPTPEKTPDHCEAKLIEHVLLD